MNTELGRISNAFFGILENKIGIHFTLSGPGWGVSDSWSTWAPGFVDPGENSLWTEEERDNSIVLGTREIANLLKQAKVNDVSDLINTPVQVTFKDDLLLNWRVLTEVLPT